MPAYNYTTLDDPLQTDFMTQANGINDAGQIVGQYHNSSGYHGFLYSAGTYTPIDDPLATISTVAYDINDAGQIVGFYASNATHGFLYNPNSMNPFTTLDYPGATTTTPTKINASGQVVGLIFNNVGSGEHGFLYSGHPFLRHRRAAGDDRYRRRRHQRSRSDRRILSYRYGDERFSLRPEHRHLHPAHRSRRKLYFCRRYQRCRPDRREFP
jgi:probable HAF family extracellular repeat protein